MPIALRQLAAAITKETRLIVRDPQALAVLFIVPVVFVTILSLALRDVFSARSGTVFSVLVVDEDHGLVGETLKSALGGDSHFRVAEAPQPAPTLADLESEATSGRYRLIVMIPPNATKQARARGREQLRADGTSKADGTTGPVATRVLFDPGLRPEQRNILLAILNGVLAGVEARLVAERVIELARNPYGPDLSAKKLAAPELFTRLTDTAPTGRLPAPTSVQQNAPGWTLLAMFFLAVPLSVTFIRERAHGGLLRLQSMPVPGWVLFGGKIAPYLVINQIQMALIFAVGVWGLPLLGGDRLTLGDSPAGIALLAVSASLAAIGFALLVATIARTPEQATTLSATVTLTLAAIGGVMVPTMVMPPFMQKLAVVSPFSWGLDGFLDIFIRGGGVREVWPEAARLGAFALACLGLALLRYRQAARRA
jgi:ABC-2 type transport system permease protein